MINKIIDGLYLGDAGDAEEVLSGDEFEACLSIGSEFLPPSSAIEFKEEVFADFKKAAFNTNLQHMIVPVEDMTRGMWKYFETAFEFIEANLSDGKVFVHCFAGVSRSPSMIFAYLIYKGYLPHMAYKTILTARPFIDPHDFFLEDTLEYFKYLIYLGY